MSWLGDSNMLRRSSLSLLLLTALVACSYTPPPELEEVKEIYKNKKDLIHDIKNICQSRSGHGSNFRVERSIFGKLYDPNEERRNFNFSKMEADIIHHAFDQIQFDQIDCSYDGRKNLSIMTIDFYGKRMGYTDYYRSIWWTVFNGERNPRFIELEDPDWYIRESDAFSPPPEKKKPQELPASEFQPVGLMDFGNSVIHLG